MPAKWKRRKPTRKAHGRSVGSLAGENAGKPISAEVETYLAWKDVARLVCVVKRRDFGDDAETWDIVKRW